MSGIKQTSNNFRSVSHSSLFVDLRVQLRPLVCMTHLFVRNITSTAALLLNGKHASNTGLKLKVKVSTKSILWIIIYLLFELNTSETYLGLFYDLRCW